MEQEQFDRWLQEAAKSYHEPPDTNLDTLWEDVQRGRAASTTPVTDIRPRRWHAQPWLRMAAILVVGVGIGRLSVSPAATPLAPRSDSAVVTPVSLSESTLDMPDAERYLGQTVALLASLQSGARSTWGDTLMTARASRLLSTTRFLLDSPSASDPNVRTLLEDLELVLVQIVQIPSSKSAADVELIHQAMQQRDVMPRLRSAVANLNSAD
jgi:hypothetical protein